jgi:hypothetical protein
MKLTLLLPHGEADRNVVETLVELAQNDLMHGFGVVDIDGSINLYRGDTNTRGELWAQLAELGRLDLVRIIVVDVDGSPLTPAENEFVNALRKPLIDAGIAVVAGSVIAPLKGADVDPGAMSKYWNFNLVLVPEDGLGEALTQPRPMVDRHRRQSVAASAVALVGGLWSWLDEAPLDDTPIEGHGDVQRLRLARIATRVIDAGDLTARTVSWAISDGARLPAPPGCVRHGAADQAAALLLEALAPSSGLSSIGFSYRPLESPVRPGPKRMKPWEAIKYFAREIVTEIKPLPRQAVMRKIDDLKAAAERSVQDRTFGADSDVAVSLRQPTSIDLLLDGDQRRAVVASLPRISDAPIVPSPATWSTLLTAVLAAADGADMPKELAAAQPEWLGKRAVITDLAVLADPELASTGGQFEFSADEMEQMGWHTEGTVMIGASDVLAASLIRDRISQIATSASLTSDDADPVSSPPAGDLIEDTEGSDPVSASPASRTSAEFGNWVARRDKTLLWRLASRLADAQSKALDDLARTHAELEALLAEMRQASDSAQKLRKRFVRRGLLIAFVVVLLAAASVVGFVAVSTPVGAILAGVFVVGLLAGLAAIYRMARTRVRWRHRLAEFESRPAELLHRRQQAASEYTRLSSLYDQFQDWSQIVAAALHRPWGTSTSADREPWVTDTGALSFSCGQPTISQEQMTIAALGVAQRLATQGWLTRAFTSRRDRWLSWYDGMTSQVAGIADTPEADCTTVNGPVVDLPARPGYRALTVYAPREHFRRSWLASEFADEYREAQIASLRQSVDRRDPSSLIESIESDIEALSGRSAREFLIPIVESPATQGFTTSELLDPTVRVGGSVDRITWCGISPSVGGSFPEGVKTVPVHEPKDRMVLASFRLDVSAPLEFAKTTFNRTGRGVGIAEPEHDELSSPAIEFG